MIERQIEKSHSHAALLGRDQGPENPVELHRIDAFAGILDQDTDALRRDELRLDAQKPRLHRLHRFDRIHDQVEDHLL